MEVIDKYERYHFISGVDLPLLCQDDIHNFFNENEFEYLHFTSKLPASDYKRVSRFHFDRTNSNKIYNKLMFYFEWIQELLNIDRFKKYKMDFYKGENWCTLTHAAVICLVKNEKLIRKMTRWTSNADECFKQIILVNFGFKERLYMDENGRYSGLRYTKWTFGEKSPHILTMDDYNTIMSSGCIFARKFDENIDKNIIERIVSDVKTN